MAHMLCNDGVIAARFSPTHGRMPTGDDVTAIYNRFMSLQAEEVGVHSAMIPGTLDTVTALREAGSKINTCSGYPRVVMDRVIDLAAKIGYTSDCVVACDEMPRARPWSAQAPRCVTGLAIDDIAACVKADDAAPGIKEDHRVGMWTVALLVSGNTLGLPYEQHVALPVNECARHRVTISAGFAAYRPHYGTDTVVDPPEVVADINRRLMHGEHLQHI